MQGMMFLKFKRDPCQTQAVFIEPLLCACEIRISLGVHVVDHYFTIIKQFLGEKSDVCIQESLEQSRHAESSPGSETGDGHWEENLRPWRPRRRTWVWLCQGTPTSLWIVDLGGDGHTALSQISSLQDV